MTDQPCGRTVAPILGSLGSAAKVNNECIFLLHITRPDVMMLILCQLHLFSHVSIILVDMEDVWAAAVLFQY